MISFSCITKCVGAGVLWAGMAPLMSGAELRLVPTFENCSVYVTDAEATPEHLRIRYRVVGETSWIAGHRLVASAEDPEPRGSLFGLLPASTYEVECQDQTDTVIAQAQVTTWSDEVPIARTVDISTLAPGGGPVLIDQGGSPEGWVRYIRGDGAVIEGGNSDTEAILLENVSYVIVEDLIVRGGKRHGIRVAGSHHVRIRGCDIAGFGRVGEQRIDKDGKFYDENGSAINYDAGVYIDGSSQVVIERNFVHDPRNHANSWYFSHPSGPNAVFVRSEGGLVIRWNDFVGSDLHRWNDVIEGYGNGKPHGGPNCDSDIYGNFLAFANDDGIELDGPQRNVRFFGNRIEGMLCGISTAPNLRGPSFIYGNVVANLGDERGYGSAAVKNGGGTTYSQGMTFFYHNTFATAGHGIAGVGFGSDKDRARFLAVSRNNCFALTGNGIQDAIAPEVADYDYDAFSTPRGAAGSMRIGREMEAHAVVGNAHLTDLDHGDLRPAVGSPLIGAAEAIPGFDWLQKAGKDIGAVPASGRAVPWRPLAITALPAQIVFRGAGPDVLAESQEVVLAAGSAKNPVPFIIRQTDATPWLEVSPRTGTIPVGGEVRLRVALNSQIWEHHGSAPGAFLVQVPGQGSIPITVDASVRQVQMHVVMEAEQLPGADGFTAMEAEDALGGKYLDFVAAQARKIGDAGLVLTVEIPADGRYTMSLRVRCPDPVPSHDSIFLGIDDEELQNSPIAGSTGWSWTTCTGKNGIGMQLSAGTHRIHIRPREQLDLDAILISARPFALTEDGPSP